MKRSNKVLYLLVCLVIIAGIIVWKQKGFNLELQYSTRNQISISNNQGINTDEVKAIVSDVLGNNARYVVQDVETFGNAVSIVADEITNEQKNEIINKFNDKYKTKIKADDTQTVKIPFTRISDILRPFIVPAIIIFFVVSAYFIIRFQKIELKKVLMKIVIIPIFAELLLYSIIVLAKIPFGRIAISGGVLLYTIIIGIFTNCLENERENKILEEINQERND